MPQTTMNEPVIALPPPSTPLRPPPHTQQTDKPSAAARAPPSRRPPPSLFLPGKIAVPNQAPSPNSQGSLQGTSPSPSSRSNSPSATTTLRDIVYNGVNVGGAVDMAAYEPPTQDGEGILDQPVTTPTARTPTNRVVHKPFPRPQSPSGPHCPSTPCSRPSAPPQEAKDFDGIATYPSMPEGFESPCTLPSLIHIRQLDIPAPSRSLVELKEEPAPSTIIESRICRNMTLKHVELRNCHVSNCTLHDCVIKGGYHRGSRFSNCDIISAQCVVSCVLDRTFSTLCIMTNSIFRQGGIKESRIMDSSMKQVGVFYCRLTRCSLSHCEVNDLEQLECPFVECTANGDINHYFEPPKKHTNHRSSSGHSAHKDGHKDGKRSNSREAKHRNSPREAAGSKGSEFNRFYDGKVGNKKSSMCCM
eukprot:GDKJ01041706.1.p1 GENE.GDKJ01041706.1~~GDKJ01041706.1.p1  ORF type:complete len:417 (+),score=23.65 GDKJ01041706.1:50-1300(+)